MDVVGVLKGYILFLRQLRFMGWGILVLESKLQGKSLLRGLMLRRWELLGLLRSRLWFYVKPSFDLGGREFLPRAEELLARFGEEIQSYGIGSINELFDGDPPHAPWGAVSQAWSVGAVLKIRETTERWRRRRGHGLLPRTTKQAGRLPRR